MEDYLRDTRGLGLINILYTVHLFYLVLSGMILV